METSGVIPIRDAQKAVWELWEVVWQVLKDPDGSHTTHFANVSLIKERAIEIRDKLATPRGRDMTIIVHPTQSGHVRIVVSADGPAETLMTPDEAKDLARRLLWAVGLADAVRMRGLDDEVGVGLTDPGA